MVTGKLVFTKYASYRLFLPNLKKNLTSCSDSYRPPGELWTGKK